MDLRQLRIADCALLSPLAALFEDDEDFLKALADFLEVVGGTLGEGQAVLATGGFEFVVEMLAGAGDGEALVVEQGLDAQDIFHVALTIHALAGAALDRLELGEFGFPETQDVRRKTTQGGHFTNAEVELVGDDRIGDGAALFLVGGHEVRIGSGADRSQRDSESNCKLKRRRRGKDCAAARGRVGGKGKASAKLRLRRPCDWDKS
jgi:hypothetical protein